MKIYFIISLSLSYGAFGFTTCPNSWIKIGKSCYKFVQKKANWHDARAQCQNLGGDLATHIGDDMEALVSEARRKYSGHSWWIGINDIAQEGIWKWTDGTLFQGLSTSSAWWGPRQPNNLKGDEDCAHLWHLGDMKLGDTRCSADQAFDGSFQFRPLCKYSECPYGWQRIGKGCYKFVQKKANWHDARSECQKLGGDLATHLEDDLQFLIREAERKYSGHSWWIGMNDISQEGIWKWTDGTKGLSTSSAWWGPRQPNNLKGDEDCAHLWHLGHMKLGDTRCSADQAFDGSFQFRPLCKY